MVYAKFYSAQPDASVIETDKALFSTKMEVLKKQGCEYIQKFTGTKISKYYSVVAVGYGSAFITRVNEVNQIYGMSPAIIKKEQENYYVTYILQR